MQTCWSRTHSLSTRLVTAEKIVKITKSVRQCYLWSCEEDCMSHRNLMRRPADDKSSDNHQHQLDHLPLSSCLRWNTSYSFSWAGGAVELGHDHGVADAHQEDGDEEHHNVHKEVVDLFDLMNLNNFIDGKITRNACWENLIAWALYGLPRRWLE